MKNSMNTQIHIAILFFVFVGGPYVFLCCSQEDGSYMAPMEEKEQKALYHAIQGFVGKWWNGSDLYPDPCGWTPIQGVSCDLFNGSWYATALNIGPLYDNSLECAPNAEFTPHLFELNHLKSLSFYNCFTLPTQNPITIPTSNWEKLSKTLDTLEFRSNPGLTGAIPTDFGYLKNLQSLVLLENGLTGELPVQMGNLVNLKRLVLAGNHLVGQIPASWGNLTRLLILDSSRNSLSGSIPLTFGGLTSLLKLDLSNNFLGGKLPIEIGNLKNLTIIDLGNNKFSGGLVQSIEEMVSLEEIVLSKNPIGGDLMGIQWDKIQNLEYLDLSKMGLTGEIPDSMTELERLRFLGLNNNFLSGNISPRFEAMPCISALYLQGNKLTGEIEFSEMFFRKMGSRFRVSNNPNLCYTVELVASGHLPFGVKLCQDENRVTDRNETLHQDSLIVASLGISSCGGNVVLWGFMEKEIFLFVVWILLL